MKLTDDARIHQPPKIGDREFYRTADGEIHARCRVVLADGKSYAVLDGVLEFASAPIPEGAHEYVLEANFPLGPELYLPKN